MKLSGDLKFLADLARSLVEVRALLSLQRADEDLVRRIRSYIWNRRGGLRQTMDVVATMQSLLERSSELSCGDCSDDSAVGQDGGVVIGTNGRYTLIRCDDCAHESFAPASLFGGMFE